jgi:hypothetical protein
MEGRSEVLEFRSFRLLEEKAFLSRINGVLPPGIRFRRLVRIPSSAPALPRIMSGLVYSLERPAGLPTPEIRRRLEAYRDSRPGLPFEFGLKGRRLVLKIPLSSRKPPRPQDIVAGAFGLENPAFLLRRDGVALV